MSVARGQEVDEAAELLPPAVDRTVGIAGRGGLRLHQDDGGEQCDHQNARADGGDVEGADRGLGDQAVDDEGDARRNEVAERAAGRERAEHHLRIVGPAAEKGRATDPMVAAVATEDPEMAEKMPEAAMLVCRRPPGMRFSQMFSVR